ncbi:MAG: ABC transporter permease [Dehalococcoidia bacterium]|nr:ABC transporter permease [Dehalococcoidia bacterium]
MKVVLTYALSPIQRWARVGRLPSRKALIAFSLFGIVTLMGVVAPILAPHDPKEIDLANSSAPPIWARDGSPRYVLGADPLGRDVLSRVLYGFRTSLAVAFASVGLGQLIGVSVGLVAGYFGGIIGAFLMRVADINIAFPAILLAMLLGVIFGPGFITVTFAIGAVLWARVARVLRGEVLSIKERDFVLAARAIGCTDRRILVRHILPNLFNIILVLATLEVGSVILLEASLTFLGAGIPPPNPTLGGMVVAGRDYLSNAWWISMFPGLAIVLIVVVYNLTGNAIRDVLDPTLRRSAKG